VRDRAYGILGGTTGAISERTPKLTVSRRLRPDQVPYYLMSRWVLPFLVKCELVIYVVISVVICTEVSIEVSIAIAVTFVNAVE
jgi:hypothetical protein